MQLRFIIFNDAVLNTVAERLTMCKLLTNMDTKISGIAVSRYECGVNQTIRFKA